jgi:hypothetical protein
MSEAVVVGRERITTSRRERSEAKGREEGRRRGEEREIESSEYRSPNNRPGQVQ